MDPRRVVYKNVMNTILQYDLGLCLISAEDLNGFKCHTDDLQVSGDHYSRFSDQIKNC